MKPAAAGARAVLWCARGTLKTTRFFQTEAIRLVRLRTHQLFLKSSHKRTIIEKRTDWYDTGLIFADANIDEA